MASIWELLQQRNRAASQGTPTAEALLNSLIESSNPGLSTPISIPFGEIGESAMSALRGIGSGGFLGALAGGAQELSAGANAMLPPGSVARVPTPVDALRGVLFGQSGGPATATLPKPGGVAPAVTAPLPAGKPNSWQLPATAGLKSGSAFSFNPQNPMDRYIGKMFGAEGTGKNPKSSAKGYGQFLEGTWIEQAARYGTPEQRSLAAAALEGDKDARSALLAQREDQEQALKFGRTFTQENMRLIGEDATEGQLYLAHFLGGGTASKVLKANPSDPIDKYVSEDAIKANPSILKGKTVGEVTAWADATIGAQKAPSAFPAAPQMQPTQFPDAPAVTPQVAADPSKMLEWLAQTKPGAAVQNTGMDRLMGVLGGLAQGATGGRTVGEILARAGAGAAAQVSALNQQDEERQERQKELMRLFAGQMAQGEMTAANLRAQGTNYGIQAGNANAENRFKVAGARAENEAAVANKNAENAFEVAQKKYSLAAPKISVGEDGKISIVQTDPDTQETTVKQVETGTGDLAAITKLAEQEAKLDKVNAGAPAKMQIYAALNAKGGDPAVKQTMLGFAVEQGALRDILGEKAYKELEKAVTAKVPATEQIGEAGQEKLIAARKAEVMRLYNERKISDEALVKAMAFRGDPAAQAIIANQSR